ncbi:membrane-bound metal-dependent hydrolase YbcI (DUF457 family) [Lipingzhangella halophila]|uniref:Membrane-bound metal-dependent hydrolase YbcI (DUF457 family) n=1 Tax=Lipingzhangella halophila TaxID=1783352 RepID=A0A7W7RG36_9ACTN|nr:metal-dependent hydrolase [Lipingzhangella halophila]MBB4931356.1 membrane-bound metal-dependent hydrolase YbcI (DUF457 family) [Lipingzhangella halophila]
MMASSHSATGALAGVATTGAIAPLLGSTTDVVTLAVGAAVGAGAALLPDLDHPEATATRSQGPITAWACTGLRALSSAVWMATRTPADYGGYQDGAGAHRHLTHTLPAAVVAGVLVWAAALHSYGMAAVLWLLISLGLRGLGQCLTGRDRRSLSQWTTVSLGAGLATVVVMVVAPPAPSLLGAVVAVGMGAHILGDWLTPQGVPLTWPLRRRGKRWWMYRSPVAFKADDECWQEKAVQWVCWSGTPLTAAWAIV